jgi:SdpI/YfhL protein family
MQKVGPNPWYGFRVAKTLSDPRIWYSANRIVGYDLCATGILVCVSAATTLILVQRLPDVTIVTINLGVMLAALGATLIHAFLTLDRL